MWHQLSLERQRERPTEWTLPIQWVSLSQNPPVVIEGQVGALSAQTDLEGSWLNSHFLSVFPSQRCGQQEYILHNTSFCFTAFSTLNVLFVPSYTLLHIHTHTEKRDRGTYVLCYGSCFSIKNIVNVQHRIQAFILPTKKYITQNVICNDFKQKHLSHDIQL